MLYLGCPIWTSKHWSGDFLPPGTPSRDSLAAYGRRLNMVEGNTTFYAMPSVEMVTRWRDETPPGFRFCLKFPRIISHDYQLRKCEAETAEWILRLRLLEDRAGPSFLQLPRDFSADSLTVLASYLKALPTDLEFSVEPRHPSWFLKHNESNLNNLLAELGIARVIYDVRPLRAAAPSTPDIRSAQQSKPHVPARAVRTANHTLIRYISHPELATNDLWLAQWKTLVAKWLAEGNDVYFCMHSINEAHMPLLCREFHERVAQDVAEITPLPDWTEPATDTQMSLF